MTSTQPSTVCLSANGVGTAVGRGPPATWGGRRVVHIAPVTTLPHFCWAWGRRRGPWLEQKDRLLPIWSAPFKKPQTAGVSKKVPYPCKNVHLLFRYALVSEREITEFAASPDVHRTYG